MTSLLAEGYAPYRAHFPGPMWQAYRDEIDDLQSRSDVAQLIVAVSGSTLLGTVTFYPSGDLDGHGWPPSVASFRLLAVASAARGQGVGRRLVEECIDRARDAGASALGLHTAPFMKAAVSLYEAMGFSRAPDHDFAADEVYVGAGSPSGIPGWAYLLALHPSSAFVAREHHRK